jgi:hypothetical protein
MLNIAFVISGEEIKQRYRAVEANTRLLRLLNDQCVINLVLGGSAKEIGVNIKLFDHIYEAKPDEQDNHVSFLAKTLPLIQGDNLLYLDENLFSFSPMHVALTRNMTSGVYVSKQVLDFRGNIIDPATTWTAQQLMSKHGWPIVSTKCIFLNKDEKSKSFFRALEQYSLAWTSIGENISDGAMKELTLDNVISFVCQTNDDECVRVSALDYRDFGKRDFARDNNWVYKDWHDWLDVWWVSKGMPHLRIENFRQQGLVYLSGNYIEKVEAWLEKISP